MFTDTIHGRGKKGLSSEASKGSFERAAAHYGSRKFKVRRISRTGQSFTITYGRSRTQETLARLQDALRFY